jgi:hypothetical protein
MNVSLVNVRPIVITGLLFCLIVSCGGNTETYTLNQFAMVRDSVRVMAESIANDVSREGPLAWLRYFENAPDFFMASEGRLVFPNNDSATNFIKNTLVKSISKIELHWNNIRIDPLTTRLAGISADFHEDITDYKGRKIAEDGYFTGIAEQTFQGWKLRNAHWSVIGTKQK